MLGGIQDHGWQISQDAVVLVKNCTCSHTTAVWMQDGWRAGLHSPLCTFASLNLGSSDHVSPSLLSRLKLISLIDEPSPFGFLSAVHVDVFCDFT